MKFNKDGWLFDDNNKYHYIEEKDIYELIEITKNKNETFKKGVMNNTKNYADPLIRELSFLNIAMVQRFQLDKVILSFNSTMDFFRGENQRFSVCGHFTLLPSYHAARKKATGSGRIFCPLSAAFLYRSLAVSPAGPAAALHLLGTDLRRWTAGTCRPSAAQGFARWKAPARCPPCGERYLLAQSVPSARRERCSTLPVTHS